MITSITSPFEAPVASGTLCVILDACFDMNLPTTLKHAYGYTPACCVPLFEGTPYAGLQAAGPYVLRCPAHGELADYARGLLERADAGYVAYLADDATLAQAVEHWRSLLTMRTDTSLRMLRFFDPRWLEPLLTSFDERERAHFIGPCTDLAWRNELGWRHCANPYPEWDGELRAPGWLYLSQAHQAGLEQRQLEVLAQRLAQDYQRALPMPEPVEFVLRQLLGARRAGYAHVAEFERWLCLALRRGDGFWHRLPDSELLARNDLASVDKLSALERL